MNRMGVARVRKIVPISTVTFLLFFAPLQLASQEREFQAHAKLPAVAWLTALWSDLTAWLAGEPVPTPSQPEPPAGNRDSGCTVDPHGGDCGG
jgi:hypothetical protein